MCSLIMFSLYIYLGVYFFLDLETEFDYIQEPSLKW